MHCVCVCRLCLDDLRVEAEGFGVAVLLHGKVSQRSQFLHSKAPLVGRGGSLVPAPHTLAHGGMLVGVACAALCFRCACRLQLWAGGKEESEVGVALVQLLATAHMITGRQRMCMRQCACVNVSISSSLADRACARLPSRSRVIEVGGWQSLQPPARPLAPALPASVWAAGIWGQLARPARVCMPWCLYHSRSQGLHWCPHMQGLARDLRGLSGCAQTVCAAGSLRYRHAGGAQSLPSLHFAPRLQRKRAEG